MYFSDDDNSDPYTSDIDSDETLTTPSVDSVVSHLSPNGETMINDIFIMPDSFAMIPPPYIHNHGENYGKVIMDESSSCSENRSYSDNSGSLNHSKIIVTESSSYPKGSIYHDGSDGIKTLEKSFTETSQIACYISGTDDIIDLDKYIGRILFDNDLNYHDDSTLISRNPNIVLGFAT